MCNANADELLDARYNLIKNPTAIRPVTPAGVYYYIREYMKYWAERAPRERVSECTEIVDLTPYYGELEKAAKTLSDPWRTAFWLSELARFKRSIVAPKKVSPPSDIVTGGI